MNDVRYYLLAGADRSRRIYHGHEAGLIRAIDAHDDGSVNVATRTDVTSQIQEALALIEASADHAMLEVAAMVRAKHGWLRESALYMGLCAAAKAKFADFVPELEAWQPEYFGWRWENIGLFDDGVDGTCDRIADVILRPAEAAARHWSA